MIIIKNKGHQTVDQIVNMNAGNNRQRQLLVYVVMTFCAVLISTIFPEMALAGKFDINAGVKAATDPLIKGIDDHWGKAVVITGCAAAVIGEGDARQRAVRAGIASIAAAGVVLALLAMLT